MTATIQQIPPLILAACGLLVVLFFYFLARMLSESGRVLRRCGEFSRMIERLPPLTSLNRRDGLQLEQLEELRGLAAGQATCRAWWARVEDALEPYAIPNGPESWFATRPASELLSEEAVVGSEYHASFHQAVPALLTGLGLMATFIAILVALQGVTVDIKGGAETVQGIGTLINGLAGKFLSSIVALLLSVLFTVVEKKWCERRLQNAYHRLVAQLHDAIPVLSPTRVLLDLHFQSAQRTALLENFYDEVAQKLAWAVKTEVAPGLSEAFAREVARRVREQLRPAVGSLAASNGNQGGEEIATRAEANAVFSTDGTADAAPEAAVVESLREAE
jgi:hypothetical protein